MLEMLRMDMFKSMRGDRSSCLVVNLADVQVDFTNRYKHEKLFPSEKVFDFATWRREYVNYVREDEKVISKEDL